MQGIAIVACIFALWLEISLPVMEWRLGPFGDFYTLPSSIEGFVKAMPVLILLTLVLAGFSIVAWWKRLWTFAHRLHYSSIPVALAVVLYVFHWQHLLIINLSGRGLI